MLNIKFNVDLMTLVQILSVICCQQLRLIHSKSPSLALALQLASILSLVLDLVCTIYRNLVEPGCLFFFFVCFSVTKTCVVIGFRIMDRPLASSHFSNTQRLQWDSWETESVDKLSTPYSNSATAVDWPFHTRLARLHVGVGRVLIPANCRMDKTVYRLSWVQREGHWKL